MRLRSSRLSLLTKIMLSTSVAITVLFAIAGQIVLRNITKSMSDSLEAEVQGSFHAYASLWEARTELLNSVSRLLAGINVANMRTLAFMISAALGALGGCVLSPITMTQYDMGTDLAIKGFAAAILGGIGNPMAGFAGGTGA